LGGPQRQTGYSNEEIKILSLPSHGSNPSHPAHSLLTTLTELLLLCRCASKKETFLFLPGTELCHPKHIVTFQAELSPLNKGKHIGIKI